MNVLQKYAAKKLLTTKLAAKRKLTTKLAGALSKLATNKSPKSPVAGIVTDEPLKRLAGDTLSLPEKIISRAKQHKNKAVARAHKISPGSYHPGTTRLKRYFKADGSMKGGWTQARKNPYYNPYLPTGSRILVKKGPDVGRDEDTAMRGHRR